MSVNSHPVLVGIKHTSGTRNREQRKVCPVTAATVCGGVGEAGVKGVRGCEWGCEVGQRV